MKDKYDVIVVGAGPSGSAAAIRAAQAGLDVLLIEKRQEIGVPVRCGEATDIDSTLMFMPLDARWIDAHISHYAITNTRGERVVVPPSGDTIIVNRKVFDAALAVEASRSGADLRVSTTALDLLKDGDHVTGVRLRHLGNVREVQARLIIAADGVESQVMRWAGMRTVPALSDFYTGAQFTLTKMRGYMEPDICEYHVGMADIAPGGYVWVFPKGPDTANVGIVLAADRARERSAARWLQDFVERHYPQAGVLSVVTGGIPITGGLRRMVANGIMAVGDAAQQADPLLGGGIGLGMLGADMAMQVAVPALSRGDTRAKTLRDYEGLWRDRFGKMHAALRGIRKLLRDMAQDQFDSLVATAASLPFETMSHGELLFTLLRQHPGLLMHSRTLITTGLLIK